jgi:DNA-directed RNA polymerase subunit beta
LEYETDSNDVFYVRVDRNRKVPITTFIRALGYGTNEEIKALFGEEPKILASLAKDPSTAKDPTGSYQDGLLELYKKLRPGEPLAVENAEGLLNSMFFDARRYDLAKVGRYKFNKKLHMRNRIVGFVLSEDVVDRSTGEIIAAAGTQVTDAIARQIQNAAVPSVMVQAEERNVKILSNLMVDLAYYVDIDSADRKELGVTEDVYYPVLKNILENNTNIEDIKNAIKKNINE